jgi:hypothetical protein
MLFSVVGKGEGISKINVKTMIAAHKGVIKKKTG